MSRQRRAPGEASANSEREPNLTVLAILESYLAQLEQGVPPHPEELLSQNPKVADLLQEYLASLQFLHSAALKLRSKDEQREADHVFQRKEQWLLGDYRIIREIGRGGMGVVYEAEEVSLKRRVALKVLPFAAALEGRYLERFKNEARAAAGLHHQHIVPVYSVGCEHGVHYYAMQFIEGRSLAAMIRELKEQSGLEGEEEPGFASPRQVTAPPPGARDDAGPDVHKTKPQPAVTVTTQRSGRSPAFFRTVVRIGVQAAGALAYAHEFGVIHRDIKPANLVLDERGDLWITDFGLAQVKGDTRLTMTGDLVGTLRYMSPEQALGNRVVVDHRVDIYSLGVTLYELLTLEPVFAGLERADLLRQIAFEEPKPPRRIDPGIPPELETIVLKAMAKNADERYDTAKDLRDDLERFLSDEPIRAKRPTLVQRVRKRARRHRAIAATVGVAMIVLFVAALFGALASNALIKRERDLAREERGKAEQAALLAKRRLFDAKLAEARRGRWSRQVGQRFASFQALAEAVPLADELTLGEDQLMDLRNETIASLALADIRIVKEWEGWPAGSYGLAFDGDLQRFAYSDHRGNISVRRVDDSRELAWLSGEGADAPNNHAYILRFSPDGNLLAARYHTDPGQKVNLRLWDWKSGKIVFQPSFTADWFGLDFSQDGRYFTLVHPDAVVTIRDATTGNEVQRINAGAPVTLVSWHPDGDRLAIVCFPGSEVQVRDATNGDLLRSWHTQALVWDVAWHPRGTLLATGCEDGHVYLWDPATGLPHAVLRGHTAAAAKVQFAPHGELLLSSGWDGTCRLWDPWTGREVVRFAGDANRFSRDGRRLVSRAGSHISIWEVASSREYRALPWSPVIGREEVRSGGGLSPDGRWLAVAAGDAFRLWDLESGRPLATLPTTHAVAAAFHPSGTQLFTSSHAGLYRWAWNAELGMLRIGPALKLQVDGLLEALSFDREGRKVSVARLGRASGGASVLELESPAGTVRDITHATAVSTALSPDGQWVVTAVQNGTGVRVWEARSGRLISELISNEHTTRATFSPDGRWLLTATAKEFCLWEVGSWQPVRVLRREQGVDNPGSAAFAFDGKLLAVTLSPSVVQLLEVTNWRQLARLQGPDLDPVMLQGFTPDGSQLVVALTAGGAHVWDLRLIRKQLKTLGLDWDLPPFPPKTPSADVTPLRVEVHHGSLSQTKRR